MHFLINEHVFLILMLVILIISVYYLSLFKVIVLYFSTKSILELSVCLKLLFLRFRL